jgi:hypothetical protein
MANAGVCTKTVAGYLYRNIKMLIFVHLTVQLSDTTEQDSLLNIHILISFVS